MKTLEVPKVRSVDTRDLASVSALMDGLPGREKVDVVNWKIFPVCPETRFKLAYTDKHLLLKFWVREDGVLAKAHRANGPVWKDSCVEMFIGPGPGSPYVNFEFNISGWSMIGKGLGRPGRKLFPPERHGEVARLASFGNKRLLQEQPGVQAWELTAVIPIWIVASTDAQSLTGRTFRGNFYKCAELTAKPHFVSWNPIAIADPDFHRPDHFGGIRFI